jgi:hypothetical protein
LVEKDLVNHPKEFRLAFLAKETTKKRSVQSVVGTERSVWHLFRGKVE